MNEEHRKNLMQNVKKLASEAQEDGDPTAWFEKLYLDANGDISKIPWAKMTPHPALEDWLIQTNFTYKNALVIGCGLGDDAEKLASIGASVTAFDISPRAISWCNTRFSHSSVNYVVADLLTLESRWKQSFDFVFESRTIQALPIDIRNKVINAVANLVSPGGTLLIVTRLRDTEDIPEGPPWAVSELELSQFHQLGFQEVSRTPYIDANQPTIKQASIEYQSVVL
ncbi:Methyltransferase type 11 [Rippkaea orientalis PCC 8801]|uniref:Methyltransferase type 11 n=1 Tax=Rippkaea orientalis (strain PCC 8801 / RF-1) TaxID=41431 RepID=B7JZT1_RIPO1|nr:class I SAM-dependent methyltransferase [Rippkaea orientalis]ACK65024.1 Methyltransferase type 11 [Rippkaea orientalis PCC 8801]